MDRVRGAKDGGSLDKTPTKSSGFAIQARSSKELVKKLKEIKKEKVDKLHETLQGNNREMVQEIVEVVDETPKKTTQKVDNNLDKHNATKKIEKHKLEIHKKRTHEKAKINGEGVPKVDGGLDKPIATKKIRQPITMEVLGPRKKEVAQGMSKKRIHDNLSENNREKIQKVEKIVAKKLLIPSKSKKSEKPNLSLDTMISKTLCSKKEKRVPKCPSMLIGDYIELQKSKDMDASKSNIGEKPGSNFHPSSSQPLKVSQNQPLTQVKETINEVETNKNTEEDKGTSKRRTRGKTLMKKIHARTMEEREEVIFNEDGQPIGPTAKVVSGFSLFLGTLARNATFCPLIYTNWSKMPKKNRRRCWRYSQRKYILPAEARKWVVTTIREAWRRYKYKLKKKHFSEYSNMTERLKHRPPKVPEAHFKNLCEYWTKEDIQAISANNTRNRAQLKWVHRMGPENFSLTREKLRAKEGREPTQSEMFVETRKGNKGKQMDVETVKVISQLQEIVENEESDNEAFEAVFGKERPGRFRCLGRNITKTSLKRKSEINALKKAHNEEVSTLRHDFEGRIDRLQNAFKALVQHCNPQFNMESIEDLLGFPRGDAKESGPQMHSSTSIHAPDHGEQGINEDDEEDDSVRDEEDGGVSDDSQEDDNSDDDGISAEFQDDDISDEEDDEDDDDEFDKLK